MLERCGERLDVKINLHQFPLATDLPAPAFVCRGESCCPLARLSCGRTAASMGKLLFRLTHGVGRLCGGQSRSIGPERGQAFWRQRRLQGCLKPLTGQSRFPAAPRGTQIGAAAGLFPGRIHPNFTGRGPHNANKLAFALRLPARDAGAHRHMFLARFLCRSHLSARRPGYPSSEVQVSRSDR